MTWKGIIEDCNIENAINIKIDEIFNVLAKNRDYRPFGLLGGYVGSLLFDYYYYLHTNKEEHLAILNKKIEFVYSEFLKIGHATYCNGYAGVCWFIRFLNKKNIIQCPDIDDTLSEIDRLIFQHMLADIKKNNYDLFHGSLGMAYYFATSESGIGEDAVNLFLKALNDNKILAPDSSAKWLSEVYVNYENQGLVYNMSLSHGMAGIAAFLVKLLKQRDNKIALELLRGTVLFYKNNMNPPDYRSTFPKWIIPDEKDYQESPLGWCYGDPGMAQVLYNAGLLLNDVELVKIALEALIKSASRRDVKTEHIVEPCFCHGSSSLCHIFNRLYQNTGQSVFKDAAIFWLKDTLVKGKNLKSDYAGYLFYDNEKTNYSSLLSGLSGVGLSLLASVDPITPEWDECVFLS